MIRPKSSRTEERVRSRYFATYHYTYYSMDQLHNSPLISFTGAISALKEVQFLHIWKIQFRQMIGLEERNFFHQLGRLLTATQLSKGHPHGTHIPN